MKRILTICLLIFAIFLLHGCSLSDGMVKIKANIGFNPVIGHTTRADESVPFPTDRSFKVWALNTSDGSMVLNNEEIRHGADGWLSGREWPEAELDFVAYWPLNVGVEYAKGNNISINGFGNDDVDLLVAFEKAEYNSDSLVVLHFEHILSKVEFRIKHSLYDNMEIELERIVLDGYGKKGNYSGEAGNHNWRLVSEGESKVIYDSKEGASFNLTKEAQYIGSSFNTIPQGCENAEITVEYKVKTGGGEWIHDSMTTTKLKTDWESGKQYTYTLNITESKLKFTTGISNWNNRK
jgi:hypothetical protein